MASRSNWWRRTWQRFWQAPRRRPYRRGPERRLGLLIENLEDRTVLSTVTFTGRSLVWNSFNAMNGPNMAQMSVDGTQMLILQDNSNEPITLVNPPAGWSGSGMATVTGPLASVDDITVDGTSMANPADTFTLAAGGGLVNLTGNFSVHNFDTITVNDSVTMTGPNAPNLSVVLLADATTASTLTVGTVTIAADTQIYQAGTTLGNTAVTDLKSNMPFFVNAADTDVPTTFTYQQDATIPIGMADVPDPSQFGFGGLLPTNYTIQSDGGDLTYPNTLTTANSPSTNLVLNAAGAVTMNAALTLSTLTATAGGDIAVDAAITASIVGLTSNGGAINQSAAVTANQLMTTSANGTTLTNAGNMVGTFQAADMPGNGTGITFSDAIAVVISGITELNGPVMVTDTAAIAVNAAISDAGQTTTLSAGTAITGSGIITANLLVTSSAMGTMLTGNNLVALLQATDTGGGNIIFDNAISVSTAGTGIMETGGSVMLTAAGTITVAAGSPVSATLGNVTLMATGAGNGISVSDAITVDNSHIVVLNAAAAINGNGVITANELMTMSGTGTALNGANAVPLFQATNTVGGDIVFNDAVSVSTTGSGITETGGNIMLTAAGTITVAATHPVSATLGNVTLMATGAGNGVTVNDAIMADNNHTVTLNAGAGISGSGVITAFMLVTTSATGTTLNGNNAVNLLQATNTANGNIIFNNAGPVVSTVGSGITETGGSVVLTVAGTIIVDAGSPVSATGGNVTLTATAGGLLTVDGAITVDNSHVVVLNAALAINGNGTITANQLMTTSVLGTMLNGTNAVNTFQAMNTGAIGDISFTDAVATLTLGALTQSQPGNAITVTNTGGDIIGAALITAASGNVTLTAANGMINDTGVITGNQLLTTSRTGTSLGNLNNQVGMFQATNTVGGDIVLNDRMSVTISGSGITETGGNVTVMDTVAIMVAQPISDANQTVTLNAGMVISGSGVITATMLATTSATGTTLNGANAVSNFQATNTGFGAINFTDAFAPNLTLGTLSQAGGFPITVINTQGGLIAAGAITALGGSVMLTAGSGSITETGAPAISTDQLMTSSTAGTTLATGITVAGFQASNSLTGSITLVDNSSALSLNGITQNGTGNIAVTDMGMLTVSQPITAAGANANTTLTSMTSSIAVSNSITMMGAGGTATLMATNGLIDESLGASVAADQLTTMSAHGTNLPGVDNAVFVFQATNMIDSVIYLMDDVPAVSLLALTQVQSGNPIAVQNRGGDIAARGAILAAGGMVTLMTGTTNGLIGEFPGASVTADQLFSVSAHGAYLPIATNAVKTFQAINMMDGAIDFMDSVPSLTLNSLTQVQSGNAILVNNLGGDLAATTAISAPGGAGMLMANGVIVETGNASVTADQLTTMSVHGSYLGMANTVGTFQATNMVDGAIDLMDNVPAVTLMALTQVQSGNNPISVHNLGGDIAVRGAITAAGGTAILLTGMTNGLIGEFSGASVTADQLFSVSAHGAYLVTTNAVKTFQATNMMDGAIDFMDSVSSLTLNSLTQVQQGNPILVTNLGGDIAATTAIWAPGGIGMLTAAGQLMEMNAGSVTANQLTTSSAMGTMLTGANVVSNLQATNTTANDIVVNNLALLTINGSGINERNGNVTLTNHASVTVSAPVLDPAGNLNASAAGLVLFNNDAQVTAGTAMLHQMMPQTLQATVRVQYSPSMDTTWTVMPGMDQGAISNSRFSVASNPLGIGFTGFGNLIGGAEPSTFMFQDGSALSGFVDGGQAVPPTGKLDMISWSGYNSKAQTVVVGGPGVHGVFGYEPGTLLHTNGGAGFTNIDMVVGSANSGNAVGGPNMDIMWPITGRNTGKLHMMASGTVTTNDLQFTSFPNLQGGAMANTFMFQDGGSEFAIDGGADLNHQTQDILNWNQVTTSRNVQISNPSAAHGYAGGEASVPFFAHIDQVMGSAATVSNLLHGDDSPNPTWTVGNMPDNHNVQGAYTDAGAPSNLDFLMFQNLFGGARANTFNVNATPISMTVALYGGQGSDAFNVGDQTQAGHAAVKHTLDNFDGTLAVQGGTQQPTALVSIKVTCPPAPNSNQPHTVSDNVPTSGGNSLSINDQDAVDVGTTNQLGYLLAQGAFYRQLQMMVGFSSIQRINLTTSTQNNQAVTIGDTSDLDNRQAAHPAIITNTNVDVAGMRTNNVMVMSTGAQSSLTLQAPQGNSTVTVANTGVQSVNTLTVAGTINVQNANNTSGLMLQPMPITGGGAAVPTQINIALFSGSNPTPAVVQVVSNNPGANNGVLNLTGGINTNLFFFIPGGSTGVDLITDLNKTVSYLCNPSGSGVSLPQKTFVVASFLVPNQLDANNRPVANIVVSSQLAGSFQLQTFSLPPVVANPNFANPYGFGPPSLAVADVNGDGTPDLIVGAGPGYAPVVSVFDGNTVFTTRGVQPVLLAQFFAYDSPFVGGVNVAAGRISNDMPASLGPRASAIITGTGRGGAPIVKAFALNSPNDCIPYPPGSNPSGCNSNAFPGGGVTLMRYFTAYQNTQGGVRVAAGVFDNSNIADIVTAPGPGDAPNVRVFNVANPANMQRVQNFFAYDPAFVGGVNLAVGRALGGRVDDIVTAPASAGTTQVKVFSGATLFNGQPVPPQPAAARSFTAFPDPFFPTVSTLNGVGGIGIDTSNGVARARIVVGSAQGQPAQVKAFDVNGTDCSQNSGACTPLTFVDMHGNPVFPPLNPNPGPVGFDAVAVAGMSQEQP